MKKSLIYFRIIIIALSFMICCQLNFAQKVYYTIQSDNIVRIWDYIDDTTDQIVFPNDGEINRIRLADNGKTLYYSTGYRYSPYCEFIAYDLENNREIGRINLASLGIDRVSVIQVNKKKKQIWVTCQHWTNQQAFIVILNSKSLEILDIKTSKLAFQCIEFSKNGKKAYITTLAKYGTANTNWIFWNTVEVYSCDNLQYLKSIEVGTRGISFLGPIIAGKGQNLIISDRGQSTLNMIDTQTDQVIITKASLYDIFQMAVDLEHNRVFCPGTYDDLIAVHDLITLDKIEDFHLPGTAFWPEYVEINAPWTHLVHVAGYPETNQMYLETINPENGKVMKRINVCYWPKYPVFDILNN